MIEKIKFPDGREVDIHEVLAFLYGLSKSDIEVLHVIMQKQGKITTDELASSLKVTKASISKSINNLIYKGLISRDKLEEDKKKGRPSYVYWVDNDALYKKISDDLQRLVNNVKDGIKTHIEVPVQA
ncbi:MarR family transcriptional regulator [Acidianus sulfidivorans JP7]|uniref:TrmB family transcriptional regulator n=1 Tax=Acidianus sulfidivorans JP7 TaxID=619593 RepID=A0A2U9IN88_9CREN|nr:MarR family transcriptional regulator [Acidianus sulfidivorans]AWR97414.1 MarR family transcriptional regulator [Acidianus sulfidivorans JP7]